VAEKITADIPLFTSILERAVRRKGDEASVMRLSAVNARSVSDLEAIDDSRYLSAITKAVFKAGFVWKVIDNKWPGFEDAFWQFNVLRCAMASPDDLESLGQNESIVRNMQKIQTVPVNAVMVLDAAREHGSFASLIARWPDEDFIGLLDYLHKQGARLGGNSAQYFLRSMGKDGFVMSRDGIVALKEAGVLDGSVASQKSRKRVQAAYNQWQQETGFSLSRLSKILALSCGDNVVL
jgi:3-methyladenine DNA glycosylase Tag